MVVSKPAFVHHSDEVSTMEPANEYFQFLNRRQFFGRSAAGIGTAALASLLNPQLLAAPGAESGEPGVLSKLHHKPTAKRIIYLFMSGAPSQIDMFDYKPKMGEMFDKDLPDSVRMGQRLTTMTSGQKRFPIAPCMWNDKFQQPGKHSPAWINTQLLPHTSKLVDELAVIQSVHTEAINHDPAITYICTGSQIPGRPSLGAWLHYGLGSMNRNLPSFVVLHSTWSAKRDAQALYERLWGSGFLPSRHAGVALRAKGDPVLYLSNPPGVDGRRRRIMLDAVKKLNQQRFEVIQDPEISTRIAQYEMAYRMQTSVPELTDFTDEPKHVLESYGPDVQKPGTFAANCLLARRMAERDVRFVQVFIWGSAARLAASMQRYRSGKRRTDQRLEAKRHAGRYARDLGRRVRQDDLLPRDAHQDQLRSRSSPALFYNVDGRRRSETRHHLRQDRRLQLQRRRESGAHPRS